jgi:hypothetical protein
MFRQFAFNLRKEAKILERISMQMDRRPDTKIRGKRSCLRPIPRKIPLGCHT